jgi:hypothetical protein
MKLLAEVALETSGKKIQPEVGEGYVPIVLVLES